MIRKHKMQSIGLFVLIAIYLANIGGCPTVPPPTEYTIASKSFTVLLEKTGEFILSAAQALSQTGYVVLPFEATPTDTPANGTLSLQTENLQALSQTGATKPMSQQSLDGTATVAIYISSGGSADPCADGIYVGTYNLTITNGSVTVANPSLSLPADALTRVISGQFGICLDVTATINVKLIIPGFIVSFGEASTQPPSEQPPSEMPGGFKSATIVHSGSDELLAGPTVDPAVGFNLIHPFNVGGLALSGDGQRVWFWTYWHWSGTPPTDFIQIYSMDIDGSDLQRTILPMADAARGWAIATNVNGSVAVFELGVTINPGTFSEKSGSRFFYCTPGGVATMLYDTVDQPPASSAGQLRLNDAGTRFYWRDMYNLWSVSVNSPGNVSQLVTVDHLNFFGPWDPVTGGVISYFDINDSGSTWMTNVRFWDQQTQTARYELAYGSGALPQNTYGITKARPGTVADIFNLSGDGLTVAYQCNDGYYSCYVTGTAGSIDLTATGLSTTVETTDVRLSDDATTAWFTYISDVAVDGKTYSGVLLDLDSGARRLVGPSFDGSLDVTQSQISDDGSVLAGKWGCCRSEPLTHVWVLRDGVSGQTGFPAISDIKYRYDAASDALIVRVKASSLNGLERLVTFAHKNGVLVRGFIPDGQSPLHGEYATHFAAVEGGNNEYERIIYLNGKKDLLDGSHYLRILAIDGLGSRSTYHDIAPLP